MSIGALDTLHGDVDGSRGALLRLALKATLISVLTLGIYSFWSRTRIRRWLWSAFRVGGVPFEYTGQPLEKLMGFVFAAPIVEGGLRKPPLIAALAGWLTPNGKRILAIARRAASRRFSILVKATGFYQKKI